MQILCSTAYDYETVGWRDRLIAECMWFAAVRTNDLLSYSKFFIFFYIFKLKMNKF